MTTVPLPNASKAPYLSSMDLERIAYQTLQKFDASMLTKPQQLNIDEFAEGFLRLKLDFVDLSNNASILGMLVFSDSGVPIYDPKQNRPKIILAKAGTALIEKSLLDDHLQNRARFTIAHECAHWLIHKPKGKAQPLVCRTVGRSNEKDWLEWQADYMASALLMPAVAVYAHMKKYIKENRQQMEHMYNLWGERYATSKREQIIRMIATIFGVSWTAAEMRLIRLKFLKPKPQMKENDLLIAQSINAYLARYNNHSPFPPCSTDD